MNLGKYIKTHSCDIKKRLSTELVKARHDRLDHATSVENIEATIRGNQAQLEGERAAIEICNRRISRLLNELSSMDELINKEA